MQNILTRFCALCNNTTHTSLKILSRHYAKASVKVKERRKQSQLDENETSSQDKKKTPIITCKRSPYNLYAGYVYRKGDPITLASKGWNHHESRGDHFFIHPTVKDEEADQTADNVTFHDFGLNPLICTELENQNVRAPLEIQRIGIPKIMNGYNTILAAETGCGKTLAYILPMINQVLEWKKQTNRNCNTPLALVLSPTRELAAQIGVEVKKLCKPLGIKTRMITGGKGKRKMLNPIVEDVDVIVASFGIINKMIMTGIYKTNFIRYIVLDEVDALLDKTFEEKIIPFLSNLPIGYIQDAENNVFPSGAQVILASATVPEQLKTMLDKILNMSSMEYVSTKKLHSILVLQKFMRMSLGQRPQQLLAYIKPKVAQKQPVIVFSNKNSTAYWVAMFLNECNIKTVLLNGDMTFDVRKGKFREFANGEAYVLSTTNVGSRGLDTQMVNHILNFEFPLDTIDYIHRCGRTGRVGTVGECKVTNFISTKSEIAMVQKIEMAIRKMKPFPIISLARQNEEEEPEPFVDRIVENIEDVDSIPY